MADNTDLIIKLRAETDALRKDLNRAKSKLSGFQKNTASIGDKIKTGLVAAIGVGVALAVRQAVESMASFEFQMSKLKAISGATEAEFEALSESAIDIAKNSKFTAIEVGRLQTELSKIGFSATQILNATDAVRKLATVADADLGEAAKSVAGTINSFTLSSEDAARVANVMSESFSKSALDLEKFTVATSNSGAIANAFGVTLEENTARIAALVDANIDASKAGTDLRKIMLDLNTKGIDYSDALDMVASSSDKARKAQELVGDRAAGALVILTEQRQKVEELSAAFSDSTMEMDDMVAIMEDNLLTDWQKLISALDSAAQKGKGIIPVFRGIIQATTGLVNALSGLTENDELEKFKDNTEEYLKALKPSEAALSTINKLTSHYQSELGKLNQELEDTIKNNRVIKGQMGNVVTVADTKKIEGLREQIEFLEAKMNAYSLAASRMKDSLKETTEASTVNSEAIDKEAKSTKDLLAEMDALIKARKELSAMRIQIDNAVGDPSGSQLDSSFGFITGMSMKEFEAQAEQELASLEEVADDFVDVGRTFAEKWGALDIGGAIGSALTSSISTLVQGLVHGKKNMASIFDEIKTIMGNAMIQIGNAMVAYGLAFQLMIKEPLLAIPAGIALIAAGAAIAGSVKDFGSAVAGGSSSSAPTGFSGDLEGQSIIVNLAGEFVASGTDLKLVLDEQDRQDDQLRSF